MASLKIRAHGGRAFLRCRERVANQTLSVTPQWSSNLGEQSVVVS